MNRRRILQWLSGAMAALTSLGSKAACPHAAAASAPRAFHPLQRAEVQYFYEGHLRQSDVYEVGETETGAIALLHTISYGKQYAYKAECFHSPWLQPDARQVRNRVQRHLRYSAENSGIHFRVADAAAAAQFVVWLTEHLPGLPKAVSDTKI